MRLKSRYQIELADTLADHWYRVSEKKRGKFIPLGHFPSSTTILKAYPQSEFLTKWTADRGWEESRRILGVAGERGTKVHEGVVLLLEGATLAKNAYALDEWYRLDAFVRWHKSYQPKLIAKELKIFSKKHGYCGSADRLYRIGKRLVLLDDKTSGQIYHHFPLQVSSYANGVSEMFSVEPDDTAILQLGAKNKDKYRFVLYPEWREHFETFLAVKKTWEYDNDYKWDEKRKIYLEKRNGGYIDFEPPVLNLPEELKL